jgi:hypothetical protein
VPGHERAAQVRERVGVLILVLVLVQDQGLRAQAVAERVTRRASLALGGDRAVRQGTVTALDFRA